MLNLLEKHKDVIKTFHVETTDIQGEVLASKETTPEEILTIIVNELKP